MSLAIWGDLALASRPSKLVETFEELNVAPELTEALASEGIEQPPQLQETVIPILSKGNNLAIAAAPGSGLMVSWAVPILERLNPEGDTVGALVLTATPEAADRLGESIARLSMVSGHSVAALGSPWSLLHHARIILGTPEAVLKEVAEGNLNLSSVKSFVLDQAQVLERLGTLDQVEQVMDFIPAEAQRVISSLPTSASVSDFISRHFRRAVKIPSADSAPAPNRGQVRFRVSSAQKEEAALAIAAEMLADQRIKHLLLFCRSEDRAADLGDYLTLHGFTAGAPGDTSVPIWLGIDALMAKASADGIDGVFVVSCDVPVDPDALDRRHGISPDGVVIVRPRELAHLKSIGKTTGYETVPFPPPAATPNSLQQLRDSIESAIKEVDNEAYLSVLEPLFERYDPTEVASAALALFRQRSPQTKPESPPTRQSNYEPIMTPVWAKLFLSVGERDGLTPGDMLGAIIGESGVEGSSVGKIDIRESHSVVEVHDTVAHKVIKALNGTSIRGRAVRADFDRPRKGKPRVQDPQ